jgi:hypothetical protein
MTFVDVIDVVYDATIPYDVRFFQSLNRVVQIEPCDKVMIDMLKSIGRLSYCAVWRMRPQGRELPSDLSRLELYGEALTSAKGSSRRHMEIPGGAARG